MFCGGTETALVMNLPWLTDKNSRKRKAIFSVNASNTHCKHTPTGLTAKSAAHKMKTAKQKCMNSKIHGFMESTAKVEHWCHGNFLCEIGDKLRKQSTKS